MRFADDGPAPSVFREGSSLNLGFGEPSGGWICPRPGFGVDWRPHSFRSNCALAYDVCALAGHSKWFRKPRGAFQVGNLALHFFFVLTGINSRISEILAVGVEVFYFTLVVVGVHGLVVYGIGRLDASGRRLPVRCLPGGGGGAGQRAGGGGFPGVEGAGSSGDHRWASGLCCGELPGVRHGLSASELRGRPLMAAELSFFQHAGANPDGVGSVPFLNCFPLGTRRR